jgi:hypothetical protein
MDEVTVKVFSIYRNIGDLLDGIPLDLEHLSEEDKNDLKKVSIILESTYVQVKNRMDNIKGV